MLACGQLRGRIVGNLLVVHPIRPPVVHQVEQSEASGGKAIFHKSIALQRL